VTRAVRRGFAVAIGLCSSAAWAQAPFVPEANRNRAALEFDIWPHRVSADVDSREPTRFAMSWALGTQLRIARKAYLDFDMPFAFTRQVTRTGSGDGATIGSVVLGFHYSGTPTSQASWHIGGLVAIPTMLADPEGASDEVAEHALDARARIDGHRFRVQNGATRFRVGFEAAPHPRLFLRMSFAHVVGIPIPSQVVEHVTELEARAPFGLGSGLRVQEVFSLFEQDPVQAALEPFVAFVAAKEGLVARLGMLVALDEELGPPSERGSVVTLRSTLGLTW
jgi:hypothetical protein